jgi:hypothetical protein
MKPTDTNITVWAKAVVRTKYLNGDSSCTAYKRVVDAERMYKRWQHRIGKDVESTSMKLL